MKSKLIQKTDDDAKSTNNMNEADDMNQADKTMDAKDTNDNDEKQDSPEDGEDSDMALVRANETVIHPGEYDYDPLDFMINLNESYKDALPIMFREEVIEQTLSVLIGRNKPNALLIGSAGVGKTDIVKDIARRLENDDPVIPDTLKGFTIYELPLANIVSGSAFVGQLEEKLNSVIDFIVDKKNKAILFIDELHMIVSDNQTYSKMAEILKPALAKGNMHLIGATTLQEVQNLINNPAFNRRFSRIIVDEMTREQTVEILKNMKSTFIAHYGGNISIDDSVLETVAILADDFHTAGSHRPDTAITLLDRVIGDTIVAHKVAHKVETANAENDFNITESQIRSTAVKLATGNSEKAELDFDTLRADLSVIKGQDEIIDTLIDRIRRNDMNLFPKTQPLTFLFAGTSGVGKTEVTKIIAREMTGTNPITLNMTEFSSAETINRIIGSPVGYAGSDSNAELPFDCLESNPYQVILLDEFEKCDKSVQRLFMSVFDEGSIKTNRGKTVDFSKAIIIATTNAAHKEKKNNLGFVNEKTKSTHKADIKELSQWFDVELLNRFDTIVTFNELSQDDYREIVADMYRREAARIMSEHKQIHLAPDMQEDVLDAIVEDTYISELGARPAYKAVRKYIEELV